MILLVYGIPVHGCIDWLREVYERGDPKVCMEWFNVEDTLIK